ncbi:hypothetical protein DKT68_03910 [Micromonospora acroterricola]|uniref:Uncharacterized protein n=1 Tax=Micromonospora acroterricola TaxID=2202421 RepID=A0A317DBH5_9ACTN|nr:hypothetical protein [Micromonospora acroterricola]PWR12119.1 hypothetical protein DKT68_03910 [Micromonospora acroterricola]
MSGAVRTGWAPSTGPAAPAPARRWRRWLLVATALWAVLLTVLVWVSVRNDPPTVREQRSLDQAGPVVDRAVGELARASGAAGLLELGPARVESGCRVTPFADGATLRREVGVLAPAGTERAVLSAIADHLPASWRAGVGPGLDGPELRADAGEFVAVEGRPTGDGRVRLTVDSGCRPVGSGYVPPPAAAPGPEAAALTAALRALGRPADAPPELVTAPCPGGAVARTARSAAGSGPAGPVDALAPLAGGAPLLDDPPVYAYRAGPVTVLAELTPDAARLAATVGCPA